MKKIRLTESDLHNIIKESVYRILNEKKRAKEDFSEFGLEPNPEEKAIQMSNDWDRIDNAYDKIGGDKDYYLKNLRYNSHANQSQNYREKYPGWASMDAMSLSDEGEDDNYILRHTDGRNLDGYVSVIDNPYMDFKEDPRGRNVQYNLDNY